MAWKYKSCYISWCFHAWILASWCWSALNNGRAPIVGVSHYKVVSCIYCETQNSGLIAKSNGRTPFAGVNHHIGVAATKSKEVAYEQNLMLKHLLLVSTVTMK